MIDEKKLFEVIKEYSYPISQFNNSVDIGMTLAGIKQAIDEQHKIGGWIPCSERLPNKSGEYVVMITGAELPTCLHFLSSDKSWFDMGKEYKVSHWQPLPEAYHG